LKRAARGGGKEKNRPNNPLRKREKKRNSSLPQEGRRGTLQKRGKVSVLKHRGRKKDCASCDLSDEGGENGKPRKNMQKRGGVLLPSPAERGK